MKVEESLRKMGLTLPPPAPPMANYIPVVKTGNLVFLAGHGPQRHDGSYLIGKVGKDFTIEQGYEAAQLVALNLLSTLKATIDDLDRIQRVVKVLCMVNCTSDFVDHPRVANGCSDLLVKLFGERGRHARSAVGMGSLPLDIPVEIEAVVEVSED
jgi:enamine deaminase RidA (YjgF/YER057c/UK114 family)